MSKKNKDGTMSVLEHLAELRMRLLIVTAVFLVSAVFCFTQVEAIRGFVADPLGDFQMIFLSPPEAFTASLRMAVIAGLALASPFILYQAAAFLFPALTRNEKLLFSIVLLGIFFLFAVGVIFAYMVVLPFAMNFFLQFASAELEPRFNITDYVAFIFSFHLGFGLVFQLPLTTWALGKIGLLSTHFLRRSRKFALLIILVLAALITPPDIVSQVIIVGPLLLLYEIGILMVWIGERRRQKAELAAADSDA